jgi:hypothetical protein
MTWWWLVWPKQLSSCLVINKFFMYSCVGHYIIPYNYSSKALCCGRVRVMTGPVWPVLSGHSRPPEDDNYVPKHVGVKNLEHITKNSLLPWAFVGLIANVKINRFVDLHFCFIFHGSTAPSRPGCPDCQCFITTLRHTLHSVGILWKRDKPEADPSTWQRITITRDGYRCPRRDSKPQTQQTDGRRLMPEIAPPLKSVFFNSSHLARASSFTTLLDHSHRRTQSVGLLWTNDQLVAENSIWQNTHTQQTGIHALGMIQTRNPSKRNGRRSTPSTARPLGYALLSSVENMRVIYFVHREWDSIKSRRDYVVRSLENMKNRGRFRNSPSVISLLCLLIRISFAFISTRRQHILAMLFAC